MVTLELIVVEYLVNTLVPLSSARRSMDGGNICCTQKAAQYVDWRRYHSRWALLPAHFGRGKIPS